MPVRSGRDREDAAVGRRKGKPQGRVGDRPQGKPGRRPLDGSGASGRAGTIRCYATRAQLDEIKRRAKTVGLSSSAFLRIAALNLPIGSAYDLEAARGLLAMEARLERIEAWLGRVAERGGSPDAAGAALAEARQTMAAVRALADRA